MGDNEVNTTPTHIDHFPPAIAEEKNDATDDEASDNDQDNDNDSIDEDDSKSDMNSSTKQTPRSNIENEQSVSLGDSKTYADDFDNSEISQQSKSTLGSSPIKGEMSALSVGSGEIYDHNQKADIDNKVIDEAKAINNEDVDDIDDDVDDDEIFANDEEEYYEGGQSFDTTLTSITPRDEDGSGGRTAGNLKFMIIRLPMQYGKMNDSSLWT